MYLFIYVEIHSAPLWAQLVWCVININELICLPTTIKRRKYLGLVFVPKNFPKWVSIHQIEAGLKQAILETLVKGKVSDSHWLVWNTQIVLPAPSRKQCLGGDLRVCEVEKKVEERGIVALRGAFDNSMCEGMAGDAEMLALGGGCFMDIVRHYNFCSFVFIRAHV